LVLGVAGTALGVLFYVLAEDDSQRSTVRARGVTRERPETVAPKVERRGFLALEVKVETARGSPAAGAVIRFDGPASGTVKAGADGSAHVDRLARGFYVLRARKGSEVGTLSFELRESAHVGTVRLAGSVAIRGRVFDAAGSPLSGALVEAVEAGASGELDLTRMAQAIGEPDTVAALAATNAQGSYSLEVASGGRYAVRASAPGYGVQRKLARTVSSRTTVDFHLQAGARIDGQVLDDRGCPIGGARVLLVDRARFMAGLPKAETTTRSDGSFELAVAPSGAGAPMLVVRAAGFAPCFRRDLRLPATRLAIGLERGVAVRLRVVEQDGNRDAVPGVSVAVDLESGFAMGVTDADGTLTLENLPARRDAKGGGDNVILWRDGFAARVHPITIDIPASGLLDLGDLSLSRGGTVRGRVVEAETKKPVAGASVRSFGGLPGAIALAAAATTRSAPDGTYVLKGVPLAATSVMAFHPEYDRPSRLDHLMGRSVAPGGGPPLFEKGAAATRDIVLKLAATVRGVVQDQDGNAVAGAIVRISETGARTAAALGGASDRATTDRGGRFSLAVGQGAHLVASHPEKGSSSPETATQKTVLRLRPPLSVRGEVVDEQRRPIAGVRVSSIGESVLTDTRGAFALRVTKGTSTQLRFDHPGYIPVERVVSGGPGEEQSLDSTVLSRGPGIRGVVVDPGGNPIPQVVVSAMLQAGASGKGRPWGEATSDEQGRFAIHGLAHGEYRLDCRGHFADAQDVHTGAKKEARVVVGEETRLTGRVLCSGEPVPGARITASMAGATLGWATSRVDGSFVLGPVPPDARVELTVRHDGYRTNRRPNTPVSGEVVIELESGVQVGGTVELLDGTAVPGALVEVLANGNRARLAQADGTGKFMAGDLPEGELGVRVLESGMGLLVSEPMPVTARDLNVRVIAARGESITGMVLGQGGAPASGVRVQALDGQGRVVATAWVGRRGSGYALRGLSQASYTLRAQCEETAARAERAGIAAGDKGVELKLEKR
jgi:protocatechuate 3,4-dioxygenase beta subunit